MREVYLGLMSGSSLDGVDAVLVDCSGKRPSLLAQLTYPLPEELRAALEHLSLSLAQVSLDHVATLDHQVAELHALAANALIEACGIDRREINAIGMHGQTVAHRPSWPNPYSWQLGDGNTLAELTGLNVACDFRRRDVAAGGSGAPLLPALHAIVFRHPSEFRAVLNLGGIGNLTLVPPGPQAPIRGFDTGPANSLLDLHANAVGWGLRDENGANASLGAISKSTLARLLQHPFFAERAPKSTHRDAFGYAWAALESLAPVDLAATLTELTATSIALSLRKEMPECTRLLVCGGGVHNGFLMARLAHLLRGTAVNSTETLGVNPDYVEAIGFALLARQRVKLLPGNLPSVTGASGLRVLGALYAA